MTFTEFEVSSENAEMAKLNKANPPKYKSERIPKRSLTMNTYQVDVTVHNAPKISKNRGPVILLTYFVRTDSEINAMTHALNCARITQAKHPRKYKGATFTVSQENVQIAF